MAVPEPLRTPGKLKVITIARENAKKTIQLCKSEKHFPKANRWILTSKIVDAAENAYRYSIHANIINVKCREDYVKRRQLMMDAKAAAIEQLALIQIAYELLSLTVSMDDWIGIIDQYLTLLEGWMESDMQRYGKYIKDD